jgi:hypothetical protein
LVKINIDPIETLKNLYNVGDTVAARIVEYRQQYGFLKGPDDLTKIDGISPRLAIFLSPHIDWRIPQKHTIDRPVHWQIITLWWLCEFVVFAWFSVGEILPIWRSALEQVLLRENLQAFIRFFIASSVFGSVFLWCVISVLLAIIAGLTNRKLASIVQKAILTTSFLSIIAILAVFVGNVVYASVFPSPELSSPDQGQLVGILAYSLIFLWAFLFLITVRQPRGIPIGVISRIFEVSLIVAVVVYVDAYITFGETWPWFVSLLHIFLAMLYAITGWYLFRKTDSIFIQTLESLMLSAPLKIDRDAMKRWIYIRYPHAEDRQLLQDTLNEIHKGRRVLKLLGAAFMTIAGTLVGVVMDKLF